MWDAEVVEVVEGQELAVMIVCWRGLMVLTIDNRMGYSYPPR